jgi:hypothetical protein
MRRVVIAALAAVALLGAGGLYVAQHPLVALPTLVRAAGGTVVNNFLSRHPLVLGDGRSNLKSADIAVRVAGGLSPAASALAQAVAGAVVDNVPAHFRLTSEELGALPAAVRSYAGSLVNTAGAIQELLVPSASGSLQRGQVDTVAVVQVDNRVYRVSATLVVQNDAVTGVENLAVTQP